MGVITVIDGSIRHTVNMLGPRPAGQVRQAVVLLQATDELSGLPVRAPVRVGTSVAGLAGQSASDGVGGLVGVPSRAFPSLDTQAYPLDISVAVDGFVPWTRALTLTAQATFPATFAGIDLGLIVMRRRPVTIEVSTFELSSQSRPVPLGGADVRISQAWRRLADIGQAGVPADLLSFPLGVSQRWPSGTALVSVSLLPPAEPTRRLVLGAAPGDLRLGVDRAGSLTDGDLVGLDLADADRREYLTVSGIVGPLDVSSPADVDLTGPVRVSHADTTTARRVPPPGAAPPDASLTEAAEPGDTTVFVDTTAAFGTVEILRATDPTIDDEYLDSHLFRATTNADGFARLPLLSRVAAIEITATRGALSATALFTPDYQKPANALQVTLQ